MEKTIAELVDETGISRFTFQQAAIQARIPARKSGATWLINVDSEEYGTWLEDRPQQSRVKGADRITTVYIRAMLSDVPRAIDALEEKLNIIRHFVLILDQELSQRPHEEQVRVLVFSLKLSNRRTMLGEDKPDVSDEEFASQIKNALQGLDVLDIAWRQENPSACILVGSNPFS